MSADRTKPYAAEVKNAESSPARTRPGEGERRAQRGYTHQYAAAASAIYAGLDRQDLRWVGLADRYAGVADDVVLGFDTEVIGHQFKAGSDPGVFRIRTLLIGAEGLLARLVTAWRELRSSCPGQKVKVRVVVTDRPSANDAHCQDGGTTAEFVGEWQLHPTRSLAAWRATPWRGLIEEILTESGLGESEFDEFFGHLVLIHGDQPSFSELYAINDKSRPLVEKIARLLPILVARLPGKDRWSREEFLRELDWPDIKPRHPHRFPLGGAVQRNSVTEARLREVLDAIRSGYLSLVGPPGTGKSTLLQVALETEPGLIVVRYLAFVPGAAQGVGRAEADDFLGDVVAALRTTGLSGNRFHCGSTYERREEFETLLKAAGERFAAEDVRTLIVIDGLDHVPREEHPERSFLSELPLPSAVPEGVLFLLGTQRVDLPGIPPAVIAQAAETSRNMAMTPLLPAAISGMADRLGLQPEISRTRLYELAKGHPLATHYLIEALRAVDEAGIEALLRDGFDYSGDIEDVYRAAWRWIAADEDAVAVMGLIARAEAPVSPQLLARIVPEASVQRAWDQTQHLLSRDTDGDWSIFHNSFRLFILREPQLRFGEIDHDYSRRLYCKLVELAQLAPADSAQNELELRYLIRAGNHRDALRIAQPSHFRAQFIAGRASRDIQDDIRLAFHSLKVIPDPTAAFALILAADEIARRASALDDSGDLVEALISLGDLDHAERFVEDIGGNAYPVIRAWLNVGNFDRARVLFERIEPLHDLASHMDLGSLTYDDTLFRWVRHAIHFRQLTDIGAGIRKIVEAAQRGQLPGGAVDPDELGEELRFEAAMATQRADPTISPDIVRANYALSPRSEGQLVLAAGLGLISNGAVHSGLGMLSRIAGDSAKLQDVPVRMRRHAALAAVRLGNHDAAHALIGGTAVPAIAMLDDEINYDAPPPVTKAVLEHAELTWLLDAERTEVPCSSKTVLSPLQQFAERAGQLAARSFRASSSIAAGEIGRECQAFIAYVARAWPRHSGEHFAITQLELAAPVIVQSLLRSAARIGSSEFDNVINQIDYAISAEGASKLRFRDLLIDVAVSTARHGSHPGSAEQRLDTLLDVHGNASPAEYINETAKLISAYVRIGKPNRGRCLLARLRNETLGYALPAKKDPQYLFWRTLLQKANQADPSQRRRRVEVLARQATGMAETQGQDAACRLAHTLVAEAATHSAEFGWTVANQLLQTGLINMPGLIDAVAIGMVSRRPAQVQLWVEVWAGLCLPYYREAFYRESHEGDFIREVVAACETVNLERIAARLAHCIGIAAQLDVRSGLIDVLVSSLAARGVNDSSISEVAARVAQEIQLPKRGGSTPMRYDDVVSMRELAERAARDTGMEPKPAGYEMARAFSRLLPTTTLDQAMAMFDSNPGIEADSRARFDLVDLAISQGRMDVAQRLTEEFKLESRDDSTWAWFMGGARLRFFQALVCLKGDTVRSEAYADFVAQLAAGSEKLTALLPEIDDIWPVLTKEPAWADMWQYLEEQLATTRDHHLGRTAESVEDIDDIAVVVRLLEMLIMLPVTEIQWHTGHCALQLAKSASDCFQRLIQTLIARSDEGVLIALRLLIAARSNNVPDGLRSEVLSLADHDDLAVRQSVKEIARHWGDTVSQAQMRLPLFYRLALPDSVSPARNEQLRYSEYGPPVASDPALWSKAFEEVIELLAKHGVPDHHIRLRMTYLIDGWGGVQAYGLEAGKRLIATLQRFGLKLPYFHPHILGGARALRHVAGEFQRAGLLVDDHEISVILAYLTPSLATAEMAVGARPACITQPKPPAGLHRDADMQRWLAGVKQDVNSLRNDLPREIIIAEATRFEFRSHSSLYSWSRTRIPLTRFEARITPHQAYYALPAASIVQGTLIPADKSPALVRRVSRSRLPQRPQFEFVLDEQLVSELGWSLEDNQGFRWVDRDGQFVASVWSWRDAGPHGDTYSDCLWGEGAVLTISPDGLRQLEMLTGRISADITCRRATYKDDEKVGEKLAVSSAEMACPGLTDT